MSILGKKATVKLPIPEGFSAGDIKIESSTCTGEKTIGFYSSREKRLVCAELVRSEEDIAAFCQKYGVTGESVSESP